MSSNDIVVSVKNISKCFEMYAKPSHRLFQTLTRGKKTFYKEFWALKDISFELKKGETLGVIGRNGAGKSTLLQIITGTLQPTTGSVEIKGRVAALLELGSGFNPEFSGRDNVYMNAAVLGLSKKEIDEKYDDILKFADIGEFIDQPVKVYSSGMMVRLAFAVIAHVDADILIVDEALSVGDAFFQQKCMRFLRKFMEDNTVLFVSHDTGAVMNFCDKAILLEHGRVKAMGESKEVIEQYITALYESNQGESKVEKEKVSSPLILRDDEYKDMRLDFINKTNLRNDIEVFKFNTDSEQFGVAGAIIENVFFTDDNDKPLSWVVGGEMVKLKIISLANEEVYQPIIGFAVKDRLGQWLFADNTCITYLNKPLHVTAGSRLCCEFIFRMPVMPQGDYSIMVSIAKGTQQENAQLHFLHDAFIFKSHASTSMGLVGVPVKEIKMEIYRNNYE